METPIGPEEDSRLVDFIRDEDAAAPDEAALKTITQRAASTRCSRPSLPVRKRCIRLRFGLRGRPMPYAGRGRQSV